MKKKGGIEYSRLYVVDKIWKGREAAEREGTDTF
jgi:hypothetical protein